MSEQETLAEVDVEAVLLMARQSMYPHAFDPEDGIRAGSCERFGEWFHPWLERRIADRLASVLADDATVEVVARKVWESSDDQFTENIRATFAALSAHLAAPGGVAARKQEAGA